MGRGEGEGRTSEGRWKVDGVKARGAGRKRALFRHLRPVLALRRLLCLRKQRYHLALNKSKLLAVGTLGARLRIRLVLRLVFFIVVVVIVVASFLAWRQADRVFATTLNRQAPLRHTLTEQRALLLEQRRDRERRIVNARHA